MSADTLNLKKIAIHGMKPGPNVRTSAEPGEIAALAASLKREQLHPVLLGPDMTILDGWRHWLAAQEAGLDSLWAVLRIGRCHPRTVWRPRW